MKLLTKEIEKKLAANGLVQKDCPPVVKLFTPWGGATWLLSESDPEDPDLLFGLCDLGLGMPELGSVRLSEIAALRGPFGLGAERDLHFKAKQPLSAYADKARVERRIAA